VAEARRGHAGDARGHLDAARFGRPAEFSSQATIVRIEQGLLWIETAAELDQLRAEAEHLLQSGS
jgi:hypothetical protein